jgi:hypothetical protein
MVIFNKQNLLAGDVRFVNKNGSILYTTYAGDLVLFKNEKNYFISSLGGEFSYYTYWLNDLDEVAILYKDKLSIWKSVNETLTFVLEDANSRLAGLTNSGKILLIIPRGASNHDTTYIIRY